MQKGLYMTLSECGHTYGIEAINDEETYNKLLTYFYCNKDDYKWFLQGDSQNTKTNDKSWLFIEFLGMGLNDKSALEFCEKIARILGTDLKI